MISVLYVDDEPALLEIGKLFLEDTNEFTVTTALSASIALDRLNSPGIDAIVSDYQMPVINGIEFLKQVKAKDKTIPFILFTGRGREEIAIQAFENGADVYLHKGGEPKSQFAELIHRIKAVVSRRQAEAQLVISNRLYAVLSESNMAIIHIHDKNELLKEICRILIDTGGFSMAWAGIVNTKTHILEPAAASGHIDKYLDTFTVSTEDVPRGRGPTGTAFRTGRFNVCNDIENDPTMAPWRKSTLDRGYRSLAAFPFALDSRYAGVITLFASEPGFFNDQIIRLLEEQAGDISFALQTIEHEEQRIIAENELKKSELQYRRLFQTAQDAILILDGDTGEVIDANKFIIDMLGYPREYFIGKHLWELGFLKDKSLAQDAFVKLKTQGYIRYEDLPLETKQGTAMRVEFISNVYTVGEKNIIQCNIRDITDRVTITNLLKVSERKYRRLFETAQDGILILDARSGEVVDANKFILDMLGYPLEYFIGKHLWELGFIKDKSFAQEAFAALKKNAYVRYENIPLETKDGQSIDVEFISNVYPVNSHQIIQCNIRNITERKRAEDALALASRKQNLLSSITRHDINNQLTCIMGYISLLEHKQSNPELARYFQEVETAAQRISTMIRFTKEYESLGIHDPVWNDCRTLVHTASTQSSLGKVIVKNDLPADTEVFADPLIIKVFYNLIENAVRYGKKITEIRFSLEKRNGDAVIICEDDGCGIPAEEKELIFERGFGKNTGFGLFLSREILSFSRLAIHETAERGTGARFEITVPNDKWRVTGTGV